MRLLEIPAVKSAYLSEYYPDHSFPAGGSGGILFAGRYQQEHDRYRSLLQFDLTDYPEITGQPSAIKAAYLQILVCRNEVPAGLARIRLQRVQTPWDENQATWNSAPVVTEPSDCEFFIPSAWLGLVHVDVTDLVRGWAGGSRPNYGLMVCGEERTNSLLAFPGSQCSNASERPVMLLIISQPHETLEVSFPLAPGLLVRNMKGKDKTNFFRCTGV